MISLSIPIIFIIITVFNGFKLFAQDNVLDIEFNSEQVELNLNDSAHPLEVLEYSDGLSQWIPVSRNYGNGWESVFPYSYLIDESTSDFPKLFLPKHNQGFFRKRFVPVMEEVSNHSLVSLFFDASFLWPYAS